MVTLSSFLLLAIATVVICTTQGRSATIGRVRSGRAIRATPAAPTSIRTACIGAATAATVGYPCVACFRIKNLTLVPLTGYGKM